MAMSYIGQCKNISEMNSIRCNVTKLDFVFELSLKIYRVRGPNIRVLRGAGEVPGCARQRVLPSPFLICAVRLTEARCLYIILSCRQEHSGVSLLLQSKCLFNSI